MTLLTRAFPGGASFGLRATSRSGDEIWSRSGSDAFLVLVVVLDEYGALPTFEEYDVCEEVALGTIGTLVMSGHDTSVSLTLPWETAEVRTRVISYGLGLHGPAVEVVEWAPVGLRGRGSIVRWAMGLSVSPLGFFVANTQQLSAFASRLPNGNILSRLTSSEDGDLLLQAGALVPVLGIPAWTYVLMELQPGPQDDLRFGEICVAPRTFAISQPAKVFDGQVLEDWDPTAGQPVQLSTSACFSLRAAYRPVTGSAALVTWQLQPTISSDCPGEPIINPELNLF